MKELKSYLTSQIKNFIFSIIHRKKMKEYNKNFTDFRQQVETLFKKDLILLEKEHNDRKLKTKEQIKIEEQMLWMKIVKIYFNQTSNGKIDNILKLSKYQKWANEFMETCNKNKYILRGHMSKKNKVISDIIKILNTNISKNKNTKEKSLNNNGYEELSVKIIVSPKLTEYNKQFALLKQSQEKIIKYANNHELLEISSKHKLDSKIKNLELEINYMTNENYKFLPRIKSFFTFKKTKIIKQLEYKKQVLTEKIQLEKEFSTIKKPNYEEFRNAVRNIWILILNQYFKNPNIKKINIKDFQNWINNFIEKCKILTPNFSSEIQEKLDIIVKIAVNLPTDIIRDQKFLTREKITIIGIHPFSEDTKIETNKINSELNNYKQINQSKVII